MSFPEMLGVLNKLAISKIFRKCSIASSMFPPEKVFSRKNDVLFNPRFIEGINVVDRYGCDIFSAPKLPFGVGERCEHFCVATPSHDRERGSN
ncbi:hypothetical protein Tco_0879327 [Tanacetum coccineum]